MINFLPSETVNVIKEYLPALDRMHPTKKSDLIRGITEMRKYGIEGFSKRIIYKDGQSSIFCTSENWKKIKKDSSFLSDFRDHASLELVMMKKRGGGVVSRAIAWNI